MIWNLYLFFLLPLVVVELLAILWFLSKQNLQNISETDPAAWCQKLAADLSLLLCWVALG